MKELIISKSKKKSIGYIITCSFFLTLLILIYLNDKNDYSKFRRGKWFYWEAFIFLGVPILWYTCDLFVRNPLYIINKNGIRLINGEIIPWDRVSYFKLEVVDNEKIFYKQAKLFNIEGKEVGIIDVSSANVSVNKLERTLKKKIRLIDDK